MYSQQLLETKLLAAANALRGPVDPAAFKDYIFPLLFFKRISDTWDWEHQRALEDYDDDEQLALLSENYRFVLPEGAHWKDLKNVTENVGATLQTMLQRIEEANPQALARIFGDVQWANKDKLPEHSLKGVIKELNTLALDPTSASHDLLGNAYEYLIKYFADTTGKKAGEFFTPRSVVRLMVRILQPQEGESAHDPTCGTGGMLVEMVNEVKAQGDDARTLRLTGQEVSPTTAAIARMNMFLHDIEDFRVRRGDTLRFPKFLTADGDLQRFDMVIANPPFSLSPWGHEQWADDAYRRAEYGVPPAKSGDLAFVEHMLSVMRAKTGRVAVVMPQGVLTRAGSERHIRQAILNDSVLEAVIGLPKDVFYNTDLPACILIFRAELPEKRKGSVLFIDGSQQYERSGTQNVLEDVHISTLLGAYREHDAEPSDIARSVPLSEIEGNDYELNIPLYVAGAPLEAVDVEQAVADYLEARDRARASSDVLDHHLRKLGFVV